MNIFNYHQITQIYLSTTEADPDPMDHGNWLVPANATLMPIGSAKDYFCQRFDHENQAWIYVVDESTRPSPLYDWDDVHSDWVLNTDRQAAQMLASTTTKKTAYQQQLDSKLTQSTRIAQSLEYAATRNPLSNANTARLNAYHNYIDALIGLEYTDSPIWPNSPDI